MLGILIYFSLKAEPILITIMGLAWLSIGIGLTGYRLLTRACLKYQIGLALLLLAIAWMSLGFVLASLRTERVSTPILGGDQEWTMARLVQGRVIQARLTYKGLRLTLDDLHFEDLQLEDQGRSLRKIRVLWRGEKAKAAIPSEWLYASINALVMLRPPPEAVAPGAYDFRRAAWFEGIGASGVILGSPEQLSARDSDWITYLARSRLRIAETLRAYLRDDKGALAAALLTGERGSLSLEVINHFRITGLSHLLAISGLHVGMVIGGSFFVLRALLTLGCWFRLVQLDSQRWAAAGALGAALGYLWLSGASLPTQRATLAASLALFALIIRRDPCSLRLVALCAITLLALRPESLLQAGFQMSFMAVMALVTAYNTVRDHPSHSLQPVSLFSLGPLLRKILRPVGLLVLTSLIAGGATAPFVAFHFHRLAHYGLIANLAAVPLMSLWIMPWGLLALLLIPAGLEGIALDLMGVGIAALLEIAHMIAAWPKASSPISAAPAEILLVISSGLFILCLGQGRSRWLGILTIVIGIGLWYRAPLPSILVGPDAKRFAVATPHGPLAMPEGKTSYTRRLWGRRYGLVSLTESQSIINCDRFGCIASLPEGGLAAFPRDPLALIDDCRKADIVIAAMDLPRFCGRKLALDRKALAKGGAHALFLKENGDYHIKTVRGNNARPWSPR